MTRLERRDRWSRLFNPERLAIAGIILSVLLFVQPKIGSRLLIMLFAAWAAWFSGRKQSVLTTGFTMLGIIFANLLIPVGKKLFVIGPITITETALLEGLKKALSFEALIFISKACISPKLKLPGKIGAFFSEALKGYERILEQKSSIRIKDFIKSIDEILLSVYEETLTHESVSSQAVQKKGSMQTAGLMKSPKPGDIILLFVMTALVLLYYLPVFPL